jgi:hypothetical protein
MLAQLSCQLVIVAAESLVFRGRYRNRRTQALKRLRHLDPDRDFGWHFAATVLAAHAAYGVVLGW